MGELMSHNAGFTYGLFGNSPVDKMYQADNPLDAPSLQAFIDKVASKPLLYQPGEKWVYSVSVDIQGYLVQKLSGKTFPDFLRDRIFTPLGMKDTGFLVPESKLSRVATIYAWDQHDERAQGATPRDPDISKMPGLPSGGGGLYSTAADYFQFAQMMLNGGELNGKRLLKKTHRRDDAHQRAERADAQLEVGHRPGAPAAGARVRLRLRGDERSRRRSRARSARAPTGGGASPAPGSGTTRRTTCCSSG